MAWDDLYVKETSSGAADGSSAANAYGLVADLVAIKAHLAAGNDRVILCYEGTEWTPGVAINWNHTDGTVGGWNAVVGANSSGVIDGTKVIIDCESADYGWLLTADYTMYADVEIKNSSAYAWKFVGSGCRGNLLLRVEGNNSVHGLGNVGLYWQVVDCIFNNNSSNGVNTVRNGTFTRCTALNNTTYGFTLGSLSFANWCTAGGNGNWGFYCQDNNAVFNCIADDNADGIYLTAGSMYGVGYNKCTNNAGYGIEYGGGVQLAFQDWNAFYGNGSGEVAYSTTSPEIYAENNITLTDDFYTDTSTGDYTSTTDDECVGYAIPFGDLTGYMSNQMPPAYGGGGGGRQPRLRINGS